MGRSTDGTLLWCTSNRDCHGSCGRGQSDRNGYSEPGRCKSDAAARQRRTKRYVVVFRSPTRQHVAGTRTPGSRCRRHVCFSNWSHGRANCARRISRSTASGNWQNTDRSRSARNVVGCDRNGRCRSPQSHTLGKPRTCKREMEMVRVLSTGSSLCTWQPRDRRTSP